MRRVGNVTAFYSFRDFMSNHYICYFVVRGVRFNCLEQFMMYCKAMFFQDFEIAAKIMEETQPQQQKILGRQVKGYVDRLWREKREGWILQGMIAKYEQNPVEQALLLATGDTILAEASERDTTYGVGLSEDDPRIGNPYEWLGTNLCGDLTMQARAHLRARC